MNAKQIKLLLIEKLKLDNVHISGDKNHFKIIAIGDIFKNIRPVERQKMIYTPLQDMIRKKYIHAISIYTYTSHEWKKNNILNNLEN
ncbi:MAG: BolA/IbaG family iron-sulfur metabolism protein [Buchnera aphidicola (Pentalonia nigronervosa)]|jgi:acid stress-induced BolA-like protein IbaG/YrbA|uniref:BolA/IbaG family iron-sulfur metabolism protein n=1 Tax=Buchnera aphidicola (Pentalonia nigronervosa) TaxID=1309793 RepID=A0A7H1AZZ9_9GAMM|nr:MAG: BolA/IbaG family iron-sulfur metabolism protein [Buchnera aphidicola (Pentalonia nigronervosa)]